MVTNYRLIMLALVQGRSWSQITSDLGCSRSSIDKASRVLRSTGMDEDTITALSPQELSELFRIIAGGIQMRLWNRISQASPPGADAVSG